MILSWLFRISYNDIKLYFTINFIRGKEKSLHGLGLTREVMDLVSDELKDKINILYCNLK